MALSDDKVNEIAKMLDKDIVRLAQTEDVAAIVEANMRLKQETAKLTSALIYLTKWLVALTVSLVCLTLLLVGLEFYHSLHTEKSQTSEVNISVPPCKNGDVECNPWDREWGNNPPKQGSVVNPHDSITGKK